MSVKRKIILQLFWPRGKPFLDYNSHHKKNAQFIPIALKLNCLIPVKGEPLMRYFKKMVK